MKLCWRSAWLLICMLGLVLSTRLSAGQSALAPASRPESFEWDHQIDLFDDAYNNGNYVEAERFARKSLEIAEQLQLGEPKRATSLNSIGGSLRYQKKYAEAESFFRQALAIREKVLPAIHFRTAYTLEGLAATVMSQKRPNEAEPYYLRAIAIWDRVSPDQYESCPHGKVLDGLGRVYFQAGEYEKAEPLYERALEVWTKGKEHCTIIRSVMDDLAGLYWAQGKIDRCEQMYRQTIPLLQKGLGDEQPELIAQEQAKLARVYMAENKPAEAVALYEQVVPVLQRSGSSQRELLLQTLKGEAALLGQLHRESDRLRVQGQIDAIEGIKAQSVEPEARWQGLMGLAGHPVDSAQRTALLQQALEEAEKLGPGKELARTLDMLAGQSMANNDQAEKYLKRALSANRQAFGETSAEVAHDFGTLAVVYQNQKREKEAEDSLQQQIAILAKLPKEQVALFIAYENLGDRFFMQRKYAEAEPAYLKSLHTAEAASPNKEFVMTPAQRLGRLYAAWDKPEQAAQYYGRAIESERSRPSPMYVADLQTLSELLRKLNRVEEAKRYDEERRQAIDHLMLVKMNVSTTK